MISELKDDEILEILMTSDFVENLRPEDYKYSSAADYAGEKGLLDGVCVFQYFKI